MENAFPPSFPGLTLLQTLLSCYHCGLYSPFREATGGAGLAVSSQQFLSALSLSFPLLQPGSSVEIFPQGISVLDTWSISFFSSSSASFSALGIPSAISHSSSLLSFPVWHFLALSPLSLRLHRPGCRAQPCHEVGPLEPSGTVCVQHGAAPASSHRAALWSLTVPGYGQPAQMPLPCDTFIVMKAC